MKICKVCHIAFKEKNKRQKYCSGFCGDLSARRRTMAWRLCHQKDIRIYMADYRKKNRGMLKKRRNKWRGKNKNRINKQADKGRRLLDKRYIRQSLAKQTGVPMRKIMDEKIIAMKRAQLLLHREIKQTMGE